MERESSSMHIKLSDFLKGKGSPINLKGLRCSNKTFRAELDSVVTKVAFRLGVEEK